MNYTVEDAIWFSDKCMELYNDESYNMFAVMAVVPVLPSFVQRAMIKDPELTKEQVWDAILPYINWVSNNWDDSGEVEVPVEVCDTMLAALGLEKGVDVVDG